jgi:hypothetical protein
MLVWVQEKMTNDDPEARDPKTDFYGQFLSHAVDSALDGIFSQITDYGGRCSSSQKDQMVEAVNGALTQLQRQRSIGTLGDEATERLMSILEPLTSRMSIHQCLDVENQTRRAVMKIFVDYAESMLNFNAQS